MDLFQGNEFSGLAVASFEHLQYPVLALQQIQMAGSVESRGIDIQSHRYLRQAVQQLRIRSDSTVDRERSTHLFQLLEGAGLLGLIHG